MKNASPGGGGGVIIVGGPTGCVVAGVGGYSSLVRLLVRDLFLVADEAMSFSSLRSISLRWLSSTRYWR